MQPRKSLQIVLLIGIMVFGLVYLLTENGRIHILSGIAAGGGSLTQIVYFSFRNLSRSGNRIWMLVGIVLMFLSLFWIILAILFDPGGTHILLVATVATSFLVIGLAICILSIFVGGSRK